MNKLIINAGGKSGGRNNQGVITVFHRGGGNLKKCRIIDYKRCLFNTFAVIIKFEYGYRLNSKLALICYKNGMLAYIIAPLGLARGNLIYSSSSNLTEIAVGNAFALRGIPVGTIIHNIELKPGRGGQIMRSAGTYAKIIAEGKGEVIIKLCSGTIYSLSTQSMATVGIVSGNSPILNSTSHFRL